jgi:hypothetical protein
VLGLAAAESLLIGLRVHAERLRYLLCRARYVATAVVDRGRLRREDRLHSQPGTVVLEEVEDLAAETRRETID